MLLQKEEKLLLTVSGHSLCRKKRRKARRVCWWLALMSADREKEDTPTPTERLQLVGKAGRAEQQQEEKKQEEMCKKQEEGEPGRR